MAKKPTTPDVGVLDKDDLRIRMDALESERRLVKSQLDRERLKDITNSLIETITSPQVIENMKSFRAKAAKGGSFDDAADLMSLEVLRAAGAKLPDDFRLSSRVFEDLETGTKIEIRPPHIDVGDIDPLAWGACAGGGAATVCGCAGGSTN